MATRFQFLIKSDTLCWVGDGGTGRGTDYRYVEVTSQIGSVIREFQLLAAKTLTLT